MAVRFYLSTFTGDGLTPETAYSTPFTAAPLHTLFKRVDMRPYEVIADGILIAWGDCTDQQHQALIADSRVTYLAFESGGVQLPLTATLSQVDNLANLSAIMEANNIPTDGILGSTTIRDAMTRIIKRASLKSILYYIDFSDLTSLVSSIPSQKLKAIKYALTTVYGFDTSTITGSMTFRQAIINLIQQPVMDSYLQNKVGFVV